MKYGLTQDGKEKTMIILESLAIYLAIIVVSVSAGYVTACIVQRLEQDRKWRMEKRIKSILKTPPVPIDAESPCFKPRPDSQHTAASNG